VTSITTSYGEDRRLSPPQSRRLHWEAHSSGEVSSRLTLADGRVRRWMPGDLSLLVEMLKTPARSRALLLRRGFATSLVDLAQIMVTRGATGYVRLSFNLGARGRNELLLHMLQAEITLKNQDLQRRVQFTLRQGEGIRFDMEVERPLSWL